jgi:hypothetical protein
MRGAAEAEEMASHAAEATIDATTTTRIIDNTRRASIDKDRSSFDTTSQQFKETIRANFSASGYYLQPTAFHKAVCSAASRGNGFMAKI